MAPDFSTSPFNLITTTRSRAASKLPPPPLFPARFCVPFSTLSRQLYRFAQVFPPPQLFFNEDPWCRASRHLFPATWTSSRFPSLLPIFFFSTFAKFYSRLVEFLLSNVRRSFLPPPLSSKHLSSICPSIVLVEIHPYDSSILVGSRCRWEKKKKEKGRERGWNHVNHVELIENWREKGGETKARAYRANLINRQFRSGSIRERGAEGRGRERYLTRSPRLSISFYRASITGPHKAEMLGIVKKLIY